MVPPHGDEGFQVSLYYKGSTAQPSRNSPFVQGAVAIDFAQHLSHLKFCVVWPYTDADSQLYAAVLLQPHTMVVPSPSSSCFLSIAVSFIIVHLYEVFNVC